MVNCRTVADIELRLTVILGALCKWLKLQRIKIINDNTLFICIARFSGLHQGGGDVLDRSGAFCILTPDFCIYEYEAHNYRREYAFLYSR